MEFSETRAEIFKAFAKFRSQLKQPKKDANNPFFKSKYVPLENVVEAIDAAIKGTGLSYAQEVTSATNNQVAVSTAVFHENGEYIIFEPLTVNTSKIDVQAFGSAETYARRYTLSAVFGITSELDDDGNKASEPNLILDVHIKAIESKIKGISRKLEIEPNTVWETVKKKTNINKEIKQLTTGEVEKVLDCLNEAEKTADKKKEK